MKAFRGDRGDVEVVEVRWKERGGRGRWKGGKNEKERLVFMPGSQRACKSPRSAVEDSRRLIVIHHSWQPHCSGRAWQHSPASERAGARWEKNTRRKINRKRCCLQNEQINSSMVKEDGEKWRKGGRRWKTNVLRGGHEAGAEEHPSRSAAAALALLLRDCVDELQVHLVSAEHRETSIVTQTRGSVLTCRICF